MTEEFWTREWNRKLREEYKLEKNLDSVFIDTFYHDKNITETNIFKNNSQSLLDFANSRKPFHCKFKKALSFHRAPMVPF